MTRHLILIAVLALAACGSTRTAEPEIRIQRVEVPVAVSCVGEKPDEPVYPDTDAALEAAPDPGAMIGMLSAGRVLRIQFLRELRAAYSACR